MRLRTSEPINGPNLWPRTNRTKIEPLAPKKLKLPGRPKRARKKEPDELKTQKGHNNTTKMTRAGDGALTCKNYGIRSHNARCCTSNAENVATSHTQRCKKW